MPSFSIIRAILRELVTKERSPRIPEPDLIMNDTDQVRSFIDAGRESGIVAPTYLFHCAHISEVISPGDTVIDLACGPATQLGMVARLNPETHFVGIDLSDEMLQMAKSHINEQNLKNVTLEKGDITDLSRFSNTSIDSVISTLSLHHLPDKQHLEKTFSEVSRILKPEGGLYLTDFGHLKSDRSIRDFAYQHEGRQPHLFTIDYLNSLRAAFFRGDYQELTNKYFVGRASLYSTFLVPFMIAIKSSARQRVQGELSQTLKLLFDQLPDAQKKDFIDLKRFFQTGGLKSGLFHLIERPATAF